VRFFWKERLVAKRTIHVLVDDLDGGDAEETVKFGLDGIQYEIDLSKKNANKMRDLLSPYVSAGTKVGRGGVVAGGRAAGGRGRGGGAGDRDQNRAIREWAQSKGIAVSDRGRIKQEIVDRYNAEAGR
jgi:Lsr2